MKIFLTGATGFVGKHLLYYILKDTEFTVTIPIREKKGKTPQQRFQSEFTDSPLFKNISLSLSRVSVIDRSIETLSAEDISGSGATCFIHCAAMVKFNQPLETLKEENYASVKRIYEMCKMKFIYVSTCYVHPKDTEVGKPVSIEKGLPAERFICDYAYSKYLAEEFLYEQDSEIDIVRLSCVGVPLEDLPPMRGPAHLGLLEAGFRQLLPDIWFPEAITFSVVPVDIVSKNLIQIAAASHKGLHITQLSAPLNNETFNISGLELGAPLFAENNVTYWKGIDFKTFTTIVTAMYFWIPSLLHKIIDANYMISTVSSSVKFESSIELPPVPKEEYLTRTREYVRLLVGSRPSHWAYSLFLWVKAWLVALLYRS